MPEVSLPLKLLFKGKNSDLDGFPIVFKCPPVVQAMPTLGRGPHGSNKFSIVPS